MSLEGEELDKIRWQNWKASEKHGADTYSVRMEVYGMFLEDGDFEKYQHYAYTDELPFDILIEIERKLMRLYWIKNSFTHYYSPEWDRQNKLLLHALAHIQLLEGIRDGTTSLHNKQGKNQILNIF